MKEHNFKPNYTVKPWAHIKELIENHNSSEYQFSKALGLTKRELSALKAGKFFLRELELYNMTRAFGGDAGFFWNAQANYFNESIRLKKLTFTK